MDLCQKFAHDLTVDICQAEIAAGMAKSEFFMVEAEQVEHCGVQIMHSNRLLDRPKAKFVCGAMGVTPANPAACHPNRKAIVVVITA